LGGSGAACGGKGKWGWWDGELISNPSTVLRTSIEQGIWNIEVFGNLLRVLWAIPKLGPFDDAQDKPFDYFDRLSINLLRTGLRLPPGGGGWQIMHRPRVPGKGKNPR